MQLISKTLFSFLFLFLVQTLYAEQSHHILVSVAPYKFFVEKIAGNTLTVDLMVPAGASAHTFEPTAKQIISASHADIWFQIGESFEARAIKALKSYHPDIVVVDMQKGLNLINASCTGESTYCSHHHGVDPHFWLSPRLAKTQAQTIADALSKEYPEHASIYAEKLLKFQKELDDLDQEITKILSPIKDKTIFVSHPAYAYFVRDYDLHQMSIEFEGKDPTPQQLTKILQVAKDQDIKTIFIQAQYSNKGAKLVAEHLKGKVVLLDPYSEQYYDSLRTIANQFANS